MVCVDEVSQTLHAHARPPQPPRPGPPARQDYEYRRQGACNLFLLTAPLLGWRHVAVTARRTRQDFAQMLHDLTEVHFPDAERITLVCDNLNTHKPGVLCDRYAPALARRSAQRLEWVYTPKHGSWLNIAEIEIQVLKRQALRQRFPDRAALECQTAAWTAQRNALGAPVDWRFTPDDARIQLRSLYPQTQAGGYTRAAGHPRALVFPYGGRPRQTVLPAVSPNIHRKLQQG